MDTRIIETFSDIILQKDIDDSNLNRKLFNYIDALDFEDEKSETIAFCKSTYWKHDNVIEEVPEFKSYVYDLLGKWMAQNGHPFAPGVTGFPKIETKVWVNKSYRYDYQEIHIHQNCHVCGVYYLQADGDEGDICFRRPDSEPFLWCMIPKAKDVASNEYQRHVVPKTGRMLMWRSYLRHLQKRNDTDKERIAIVFNIFFNENVRG
jgi:uncharacterized protein (TIGR02466 family)